MFRKNHPMTKLLLLSMLALNAGTAVARTPAKYLDETPKVQLSLGHGLLPAPQLFMNAKSATLYYNAVSTGAAFISCRYQATARASIGILAAYEVDAGLWLHNPQPHDPVVSNAAGTFVHTILTLAPELTIAYYNSASGLVTIYGAAGAGYQRRTRTTTWDYDTNPPQRVDEVPPNLTATRMAGHISPIGVRFGRTLSAFAELGIGYRGIVSYGISYRF